MRKLSIGAALIAALATAPAEAIDLEWRPALGAGYSKVVDPHGSISAALRLQVARYVFVQPEYLALFAGDHTDHGPTLLVGLSGGRRDTLRPFAGYGWGPVKGYAGDDDISFLAVGASYPLGRGHGTFIQGEFRYGLLGESRYVQFGVALGLSR